ncbi:probable F-box protein At1g44080 [Trifolium pratense]|uniref:probable F-box protein At1g44080 n=1 Tax=Trifolium pratense TaxID=57577 RepID=UPI001E690BFB|nr:probable F-box protein At1g44080 [Trifolium pratense]
MEVAVDWGNLEALPLSLIFDKLVERIDHIYFSVVCKNWYSIAKFNYQNRQVKNNVLPMLMIPKRKARKTRCLYGISTNTTYRFQLPLPHNKRLCGSSHGWVVKMDDIKQGTILTLLNPFKNLVSITLPPLYMPDGYKRVRYYECNVHKVFLSSNPTTRPHDYVVVAIYGMLECLAFIKAGQEFWTYVNVDYNGFTDISFYKGLVYAVGRWNNIVSFDFSNSKNSFDHEKVIPNVLQTRGDNYYAHRGYLVESLEGDLLLVRKWIGFPDDDNEDEERNLPSSGTKGFEVYKLELDLQSGKLIQKIRLDSLGDNVLFLGDNDSVSMSASYFANYLQKDSIYYTDDFYEEAPDPYPKGPFDMKIFNVKDESFSEHCPFKSWFKRMPPSIWVIPPFQWD